MIISDKLLSLLKEKTQIALFSYYHSMSVNVIAKVMSSILMLYALILKIGEPV